MTPEEYKDLAESQAKVEHARMLECRCRDGKSCILVDNALGWHHGMPMEDCDVCLGLGGEHGEEAKQFRATHVAAVIGAMTMKALGSPQKPPRSVLVQLTVKHKTISEARFAAPDIQSAIRAPIGWVAVKSTWKKAESFLVALLSKAVEKLNPTDRDTRQISCFGETLVGTKVSPPCQMLKKGEDYYWCGACGCGSNKAARLGSLEKRGVGEPSKLDYPKLECPLNKPGFSNARLL